MNDSLTQCSETADITLVIPGRDCESTLAKCLDSVVPLLDKGELKTILFVNDGSTDRTAEIAAQYPVTVITGKGDGPGAARNLGWQAAETEWIWFIDSDCVAEETALKRLIPHCNTPEVAGIGGSYSNLYPDSLLATLIHEEIVARHRRMNAEVNFLATFNVLYQRRVLESLNGFDEALKLAQDAELAFRIKQAGFRLRFEIQSCVGHHHPRKLMRYLRTQTRTSYYRIALYKKFPSRAKGDSYAGLIDYIQPPLALMTLITLPMVAFPTLWILPAALGVLLLLCQTPMTLSMLTHTKSLRMLAFPFMSLLRSHARGMGALAGLFDLFRRQI